MKRRAPRPCVQAARASRSPLPARVLFTMAPLLAACASSAPSPPRIDMLAPVCASAQPAAASAASAEPESTRPSGLDRLLVDPDRIWIHDESGGLGFFYTLNVRLMRIGGDYDAECTLSVNADDTEGRPLPVQYEEKSITVPGSRLQALTTATRRSHASAIRGGLITLEPLDSHRGAEIVFFYKDRGPPIYMELQPPSSFTIELNAIYRLKDDKGIFAAYVAVLEAIDLDPWVKTLALAAQRARVP